MKFWPKRWLSEALINRISVSVLVPAANGHSTVTGRVGHASAASVGFCAAASHTAATASKHFNVRLTGIVQPAR